MPMGPLPSNSSIAVWNRGLATILEDRLHNVRLADARSIADQVGRGPRFVNEQADGSTPVQASTIEALRREDPEGWRLAVEYIARSGGYELVPARDGVDSATPVESASEAGAASCDVGACILRALVDRDLSEAECRQLEPLLPVAILALQKLQRQLERRKVVPIVREA